MTAVEIHSQLEELESEHVLALLEGLPLADLEIEIGATRSHYIGTAVTEIAVLRAEVSGPLRG